MTDTMHRAYSVLDVKAFTEDDDFVYIEGIASTPSVDRMGDIVEPMGAEFKTPMPLLWQHQHSMPVGNVDFAVPTKAGIPFKGKLPKVKEPGRLKDRVDEAIHSLQYGLVAAVSIGFRALEDGIETLKGGGLKFTKWEWMELSLVTIPANSDAVITAIKSIDNPHLPASGRDGEEVVERPGVSGDKGRRGPVHLKAFPNRRRPQVINITIPRKP